MIEDQSEVDVVVHPLLVRQLDPEADREPAALAAAAVRRLHHARPAARDDGPARLGEQPRRLARDLVRSRPFRGARRPEAGDGRAVDLLHGLETRQELVTDLLRVRPEAIERVVSLEDFAVPHQNASLCRVARTHATSTTTRST